MRLSEPAPAKLNLALHVRGKLPDGRHALETMFAFCTDGDRLEAEAAEELSLEIGGPFAAELVDARTIWCSTPRRACGDAAGVEAGAHGCILTKKLPVASGIGGGSADAAAALRLLTRLWGVDPASCRRRSRQPIGSDVPACLLSLTARGNGGGGQARAGPGSGDLRNAGACWSILACRCRPREVFAAWDGVDRGPLGDWREGRNDLEAPARTLGAGRSARSSTG